MNQQTLLLKGKKMSMNFYRLNGNELINLNNVTIIRIEKNPDIEDSNEDSNYIVSAYDNRLLRLAVLKSGTQEECKEFLQELYEQYRISKPFHIF